MCFVSVTLLEGTFVGVCPRTLQGTEGHCRGGVRDW